MADIHTSRLITQRRRSVRWRAGVDLDNPNGASFGTLVASVHAGKVTEKEVDGAVRRFLTLEIQAGLFEHPFSDVDAAEALTRQRGPLHWRRKPAPRRGAAERTTARCR